MPGEVALFEGARNMLVNCAGLAPGRRLLLLCEEATGYYGAGLGDAVLRAAGRLGILAERREVGFAPEVADPGADLAQAMRQADRVLFLARLGDQIRFRPMVAPVNPVVSYAIDAPMLASGFGRAHHGAFLALKDCLDRALSGARRIRVTCPLGTDFDGPGAAFPAQNGDVTITRFPLSVFTPVPAAGFRGVIAQAGFLTGTGSHYYAPYSLGLRGVLRVAFDGNRITGFHGDRTDVAAARAHYDHVAGLLGIAADHLHSWHAGIHPGCAYTRQAGENLERWSGAAFGNPRILHFHSCGAYAPGEISLNVVDPTIRLDGVAVWDEGRLCPERVAGGAEILARFPCAAALFAAPSREVGLAPSGRLSARVE